MGKYLQRHHIQKVLDNLPQQYRRNAAIVASLKLQESEIWTKINCLLCYLSFGQELDTDSLIERAINEGKKVFVPKIEGDAISFFEIDSPLQPHTKSVGIREPYEEARKWRGVEEGEFVVALVPGLCFTVQGHRLGRGGGHFDRFIMQSRKTTPQPPLFLGMCYQEQIVSSITMEEHDQILDGVVSNNELTILNKEQL